MSKREFIYFLRKNRIRCKKCYGFMTCKNTDLQSALSISSIGKIKKPLAVKKIETSYDIFSIPVLDNGNMTICFAACGYNMADKQCLIRDRAVIKKNSNFVFSNDLGKVVSLFCKKCYYNEHYLIEDKGKNIYNKHKLVSK